MHFVFPKNYNFKPKLFGFIEYTTAILDAIIGFLIYTFVNFVFTNVNIKIYVFISLFLPILLISILGINKESFLTVFRYIFKFIKNQNIYLYTKNYDTEKVKTNKITKKSLKNMIL